MDNSAKSFEPMDISSSSGEALNNSRVTEDPDCDTTDFRQTSLLESTRISETLTPPLNSTCEKTSIKVYHIKLDHKTKSTWSPISVIFSTLLFLCLSISIYRMEILKCYDEIDLLNLKETLTTNLYGQSEAIDSIIHTLSSNSTTKVMFLCGGTGVGKTYSTSMIMEKVWNSSNVYHYTMPGFVNTFSADFLLGLTLCTNAIFIVDDITPKNINIKSLVKQVIEKSKNLDKNLTMILVYNCDSIADNFSKRCDEKFFENLQETFSDVDAMKTVIRFKPLTTEHLRKCIEKELGDRKLMKHEMVTVMKNFNVSMDGCKGVYTKVKALPILQKVGP